jgi:phosphoglucosamine mutase
LLEANEAVNSRIATTQDELGDQGRVLVRASGTEPVVRVMVEAADAETAQRLADDLVDLIARTLG